MKHSLSKLFFLLLTNSLVATVLIQKKDATSTTTSFDNPVLSKTYDRATGTIFFGLDSGEGNYAISKALRFGNPPMLIGIANDTFVNDQAIEFLSLSTFECNTDPWLAIVTRNGDTPFTQTKVILSNDDGTLITEIADDLNDATGEITSGIVNIAANYNYIFAAVRPGNLGTNDTNWGSDNSGIALVCINRQLTCTSNSQALSDQTLSTKNANTGFAGNIAKQLDGKTEEVKGMSGGADVTFPPGPNNVNVNKVDMYWDQKLERLYIGLRINASGGLNDIGKAVVVGYIDCDNANRLVFSAIAPDSALSSGSDPDEIIVSRALDTDITAAFVRVLHATTGPSYLIVNGGRDSVDMVGNQIRALPLVDKPSEPQIHGTLANKNAPLTNFKFTIPATSPGELATEDDPSAIVGAGDLPIEPDQGITDIMVIGDTVYVSLGGPEDENNNCGLFYSQAMFDNQGKIVRWTPWTKQAFPRNGFNTNSACDECPSTFTCIKFFAVDAVTAKVWAVDNPAVTIGTDVTTQQVRLTAWEKNTTGCCLVGALNNTPLINGSCSALDLDQSTSGLLCLTKHRYALFGGIETVVFTRISEAQDALVSPRAPQTTISDFCCAHNLLVTCLPCGSGAVHALEYSRINNAGQTNTFFAGTDNGLYWFLERSTSLLDATQFGFLDERPFVKGAWVKIPQIKGSITALKSTGKSLYVLANTSSTTEPFKSTVYRIDTTDVNLTNKIFKIAQTGINPFRYTLLFTDIEIMSSMDGSTEQLVLTTSAGLYQSNADTGIQAATNQTEAQWELIECTDNKTYFYGVAGIDNSSSLLVPCGTPTSPIAPQSKVWPFGRAHNNPCPFEQSNIYQLNGAQNGSSQSDLFRCIPTPFNCISKCKNKELCNKKITSLPPISFFWSDGARRIFIVRQSTDPSNKNRLMVLPYDTCEWNVKTFSEGILFDPFLDTVDVFNWIALVGTTGELLVGTNNGIIALK